jgi:hypothetical protein
MLLVGSSPSVLKHDLSYLIDSFDRVVRFNCYQVGGQFCQVGEKEDIWAVNLGLACHSPTTIKYLSKGKIKYIWYVGNNFKIENNLLVIKKQLKTQFVVESINFNVAGFVDSIKSEFTEEGLCFEKGKVRVGPLKKYATTGLRAIIKGIVMYGNVTIHGFDFFSNCVGRATHYYGKDSVPRHMHDAFYRDPNTEHDVKMEKRVVDKLIKMNFVKYLV